MAQAPTRSTLNVPDQETFYTPGSRGYTDYPFLDGREAQPISHPVDPVAASDLVVSANQRPGEWSPRVDAC